MKKVIFVCSIFLIGIVASCNTNNDEINETESLYQNDGPGIFGVDKAKIERPGTQGTH